ncbi:MAG: pilus assembly protein N-terminal domain-containing protein [Gemmatimonadaceae bacterium]
MNRTRLSHIAKNFLVAMIGGMLGASSLMAQSDAITVIDLPVGRSLPVTAAVAITRVSIANPEIADLVVISERELVINSLARGETDAIVWFQDGQRTHYRISVHSPSDRMQIAIAVKFAEVRRESIRQLGLAAVYRENGTRVGTGFLNNDSPIDSKTGTVSIPNTSNFLTILSDLGTNKVLACLQAEENKGNARLLAEPNILAGNRDSASFLAGGELPIPVVQSSAGGGGGGAAPVTVQYREFGIRLRFLGEILNDSLIKLTLTPEVSSLDYANAITLQGFRIPAFRTRRITTTVDVRRDQSLIISGLMSGEDEKVKNGIPYLMNIPILGNLFSSTRFQRNETELLVVVTPMIMNPMRPRAQDLLNFTPDTATPAREAIEKRLKQPIVKKP